jgi:hypothetical protein
MTIVGGKIQVVRAEYAGEVGLPVTGPQIEFKNGNRYSGGGE